MWDMVWQIAELLTVMAVIARLTAVSLTDSNLRNAVFHYLLIEY